jgi:hypothetical protein
MIDVLQSQDTQSSTVAFTCMMLGAYPDIQVSLKECVGISQNNTFGMKGFSGERVERSARREENVGHE